MAEVWRVERNRGGSNERPFRRNLQVGAVAVLAGLALACATGQVEVASVQPQLTKPRTPAMPLPQKHGVELIAEARGNVVMVTINNYTGREFWVGPKMFGVIVGRQVYPANPAQVISRFPIRKLRSGEGAAGSFQFTRLGSLEGKKLVFNSPEVGKHLTIIRSWKPLRPNYQPKLRPLTKRELRRLRREQKKLQKALLEKLKKQQQVP